MDIWLSLRITTRSAQVPRLIHRLEGDAAGERPVAQHADDVAGPSAGQFGGLHEPETVADGRRGVARTDDVVHRLAASGEPGEPAVLTDGAEAVAATGEQLVGVALVTDVPEDPGARALQYAVQRHRKLDDAEVGGKVATHLAHARKDRLADFPCEQ